MKNSLPHCTITFAALAALVAIAPISALAANDCSLKKSEQGQVAKIVDGDTIVLADSRQVRLVGTQAPKLPLGRKNMKAWPLGDKSKKALSDLVAGKTVELRYGGLRQDRHGRQLAHLYVLGGDAPLTPLWVQGEMVSAGMARTYSFSDNRACVRALQTREMAAREAKLGIWSLAYYAVRDATKPKELSKELNTFQLIQGTVQSAAVVRGRGFLNFGKNYRYDFTATVSPSDMRRFAKAGIDIKTFQGKTVRVRGWLESRNGPKIDVTHPEQIELIQ
ncbi:MAG: thermonuclease family protein [Alphaproteobacteria bacterium]